MKSHRILLLATMLAGSLSLAGCGGGGGGGNGGSIDEDMDKTSEIPDCTKMDGYALDQATVTCKKTAEKKEMEDKAKARMMAAKDRLGNLMHAVVSASVPTVGSPDGVAKATDAIEGGVGTYSKDKVHVTLRQLKKKGEKTKVPTNPTGSTLEVAAGNKMVMSSAFATNADGSTKKHTGSRTGNTGNYTVALSGSYNGAMGTYTCSNAVMDGCTSRDGGDAGIILSGGWSFVALPGQMEYASDGMYVRYGWWLNTGATNADVANAQAGAWYEIQSGHASTDVSAAVGKATYSGKAIGQAALYNSRADTGNVGGAFVADVTLNADFNANSGAGTIGGKVDNFMVGDEMQPWMVELMSQNIASGAVTAAADSTKWSLEDDDPNAGTSGSWQGQFNGHTAPSQPNGFAGGFVSKYGDDGSMVGAFGAEK